MQSLLEKQPQDVELRTIQERNPEDLTFHDVFSSFTEKDRNQLDDIAENMESEIAGIKKTLSETGGQGSKVTISERYPYSDDTLAQFILRLQNSLRSKNTSVEFWDLDDVLVNVMVWGRHRVTEKLAPMLKDLLIKYRDIDVDCSLNENCSMYFFAMLSGLMQSLCKTKIMDATDFLFVKWWFALKHLHYAGFRIDFLFDQLKRIVLANYGTDTKIYRKKKLYELETEKDKLSEKIDQLKKDIEQLTANIEDLNLESREIKSSVQDFEISSFRLKDNRLSDWVRFMMNNVATGLL